MIKRTLTTVPTLYALMLALILGSLPFEVKAWQYPLKEVGGMFIDLLKMVVVPLAFVSLAGAIVRIGSGKKTALMTGKAIGLLVGMSVAGVAVGYTVISLLTMLVSPDISVTATAIKESKAPTVLGFIHGCIPSNPIKAMADGNMLQVITLAFMTGGAALLLPERESVAKVFDVIQRICFKITGYVIKYVAPIGVFCLVYPVANKSPEGLLLGYASLISAMVLGSLLYVFICIIPILLRYKVNPWELMKEILIPDVVGAVCGGATNYMAPRINNLKENTNIPHETIDYLIPLLSVLMRVGSCICVGIYTIFAANVYGIDLSITSYVVAALLTVIALTAAPGIIGGTLMDCAIIWAAVGIPLEAIALLAGIDYLIDIIRTILNIQGGEIVTAVVGKGEGNGFIQYNS